jgi:hypothetical protein
MMGKDHFWRQSRRFEDNIKMNLKEIVVWTGFMWMPEGT